MEIVASLLRLSTWGWVFFKTKGCAGTSSRCCGGEGLSPCLCRLPFTRPLTRCFSDGTVLRVGACGGFYEPGGLEATPGLQRMRSRWMLRTAPDHAGTLHTRSLPRIKHPKLNTGRVCVMPHHPTEGVDFTDHVPFSQTSDGWVTGHLPDGIKVLRQQRCATANPGRGQGSLDPGMSRTTHHHVIPRWKKKVAHTRLQIVLSIRHHPQQQAQPGTENVPRGTF